MLGAGIPYDRVPYFFSDQYDLGIEYSGYAGPGTGSCSAVTRRRQVHRLLDRRRRVVAGMNANVWDVTGPIQALIRSRQPVDIARLTDPAVPLEELTSGA